MSLQSSLTADVTGTSATFATFHSMTYTPKRDTALVTVDWSASSATAASTLQLLIGSDAYPLDVIGIGATSAASRTILARNLKTTTGVVIALQYKAAATGTFSCSPATAGTAPSERATITVLDDVPRG